MAGEKRLEELDEIREAIISWWRAIDHAMRMASASYQNEKELRLLLIKKDKDIEDLKKLLDMMEPDWDAKGKEGKEKAGS